MDTIPDYLIENYIIPFLSSNDLFYKLRSLGSYYYSCARKKILCHFPGEMMKTLKKIIDFNTKEDLTKNFEEVTKKTFNEKRALMLLMVEMNISLIISKILETNVDDRVIELISFFYVITKNQEKLNLIQQRNLDEIKRLSGERDGVIEMRNKISEILEEDDIDYDLNEYRTVYESLDREYLLSDNYTGAIYNYLRLLIQFCETKIRFNDIKCKLEMFFQQITDASELWPKKKVFYEKSIDLIADSQILSTGAKAMLGLMKKYDIENELTDFAYERDTINNYSDPNEYEVIRNNRRKLNMAILRTHQMYFFYNRCIENDNGKIRFNIAGIIFEPPEFLYVLSMIKRQFPINEQTFFLCKEFLHHKIIYEIYNIEESKEKNNDDEKEQENEICHRCCHCGNKIKNQNNKMNYYYNSQTDFSDNFDGGIEDLKNVLENTKLAGEEINESFQKFSENLSNLNLSLTRTNGGE